MSTSLDLISVGRISLDFYANESNVGFKDVKTLVEIPLPIIF
jgi:hypothetical protein